MLRPAGIRKSVTQTDFNGASRPSDKEEEGGGLEYFFFSALRVSVWSKNKGRRVPRAPPWIRHWTFRNIAVIVICRFFLLKENLMK